MRPDLSRLFCSTGSYVPLGCRGRMLLLLYLRCLGDILRAVPVWTCVFCRTRSVTALQHLSARVSSRADSSGHLPNSPPDSRGSRLACSQLARVEAFAACISLQFPWLV